MKRTHRDQRELLTTTEAARLLGVSASTIRLLIQSGVLPGWRIDQRGHWRVPLAAVERLMHRYRTTDEHDSAA